MFLLDYNHFQTLHSFSGIVMSDSDESGVTHTEISSTFEELSYIGSPGVVPSPNYIPGPEEPQSPPPLDYVPELIYPEYISQEDGVFPAEEQPLPDDDMDIEADDDDKEEEEHPNPVDSVVVALPTTDQAPSAEEIKPFETDDYLANRGDDDDDEDESSEDDDVDIEADDDEEEEEHPAPADSTAVALPAADQALSAEETELFETDESAAIPPPHPAYRVTARISILALVPTPVWPDAEVARLLVISTPPLSPLFLWSSPLP
ncbi:hypothetical protein Tco_1399535 [Tanacetum coccineum]